VVVQPGSEGTRSSEGSRTAPARVTITPRWSGLWHAATPHLHTRRQASQDSAKRKAPTPRARARYAPARSARACCGARRPRRRGQASPPAAGSAGFGGDAQWRVQPGAEGTRSRIQHPGCRGMRSGGCRITLGRVPLRSFGIHTGSPFVVVGSAPCARLAWWMLYMTPARGEPRLTDLLSRSACVQDVVTRASCCYKFFFKDSIN
jgi:hypothetical protein